MRNRSKKRALTDNEGSLLATVRRFQPITVYGLSKLYKKSPVGTFNESKGQLYVMIRKFKELGLVEGEPVPGDARGTEKWRCTDAGRKALESWIVDFKPSHMVLHDPLRTKVLYFDLLSREDQLEWIAEAKAQLAEGLERIEKYNATAEKPFQDLIYDSLVSSARARMDWLDRVFFSVTREDCGADREVGRTG